MNALATAVLVMVAIQSPDEAAKAEMERMAGTWRGVSAISDGKPLPEDRVKSVTIAIKADGTWIMSDGKETFDGTLTVDPSKTPKTANFVIKSGRAKDQTTLEIYEIDGDTMTDCYVFVPTGKESGKERPSKFASEAGSGHYLWVMKREASAPAEIALYPGVAPGSEKWDWQEKSVTRPNGMPIVSDVVRPVLLHYPADKDKAVGTAMIVAPGGGFRALMMSYEGVDIARRLNAMGVDAFVLKYRLVHDGPGRRLAGMWSSSWPARTGAGPCSSSASRRRVRLSARPGRHDRVLGRWHGHIDALFGPAETRPDFAAIIYGAREIGGDPRARTAAVPGGRRRRREVRSDGRSTCSPPIARRRARPSCTSSRWARTAS